MGDTSNEEKKQDNVKTESKNKRNVMNANAQKIKMAETKLINACQKEQKVCIQGVINKIRNSIEYRLCRLTWQTVNEVSERKRTCRTKLYGDILEERIQIWKELFKILLRNSPKVTDKPITKIINYQFDIKLEQLTLEEFIVVLTKF